MSLSRPARTGETKDSSNASARGRGDHRPRRSRQDRSRGARGPRGGSGAPARRKLHQPLPNQGPLVLLEAGIRLIGSLGPAIAATIPDGAGIDIDEAGRLDGDVVGVRVERPVDRLNREYT